jgi:hypothetical protein
MAEAGLGTSSPGPVGGGAHCGGGFWLERQTNSVRRHETSLVVTIRDSAAAKAVAEWLRLKIAGEAYVAVTKSVPRTDRRTPLSGDVPTIRESL